MTSVPDWSDFHVDLAIRHIELIAEAELQYAFWITGASFTHPAVDDGHCTEITLHNGGESYTGKGEAYTDPDADMPELIEESMARAFIDAIRQYQPTTEQLQLSDSELGAATDKHLEVLTGTVSMLTAITALQNHHA